ncbi:MAG: DUF2335 domain-containing protein [Bacteroidetes bacterium]|nr:DUF2335 domain-containing protein [Bacteroidota bacterium]
MQSIQNNQSSGNSKVQIAAARFTGPIPPPEILQKYETILPGLAERIMKQAESQTAHRIEIEKKIIASDITNSRLGLIFAFILGLIGIGGGLYLTSLGMTESGLYISSASLVSLVSVFIYGSRNRRKEREARKS